MLWKFVVDIFIFTLYVLTFWLRHFVLRIWIPFNSLEVILLINFINFFLVKTGYVLDFAWQRWTRRSQNIMLETFRINLSRLMGLFLKKGHASPVSLQAVSLTVKENDFNVVVEELIFLNLNLARLNLLTLFRVLPRVAINTSRL